MFPNKIFAMKNITNNESNLGFGQFTSSCYVNDSSCGKVKGMQFSQATQGKSLDLITYNPAHISDSAEDARINLHEHELSSTQSSAQSQEDSITPTGGSDSAHEFPLQHGNDTIVWRNLQGSSGLGLPEGASKHLPSFPCLENNHSVAHVSNSSNPYINPYFGSVFATYGPQTIMHGLHQPRVLLPPNMTEEPIYVNAKQYQRILIRRQSRAKLEAQNISIKSRKPYLHESRHLHAVKRARGCGGRFLNMKKETQNQERTPLQLGSSSSSGVMPSDSGNTSSDHGIFPSTPSEVNSASDLHSPRLTDYERLHAVFINGSQSSKIMSSSLDFNLQQCIKGQPGGGNISNMEFIGDFM